MWLQIATYVVLGVALVVLYLCLSLTAHIINSLNSGFKRIEDMEERLLKRERCQAGPPPVGIVQASEGDLPAFARTLTEGPSGHHFHGSPPHVRTTV